MGSRFALPRDAIKSATSLVNRFFCRQGGDYMRHLCLQADADHFDQYRKSLPHIPAMPSDDHPLVARAPLPAPIPSFDEARN